MLNKTSQGAVILLLLLIASCRSPKPSAVRMPDFLQIDSLELPKPVDFFNDKRLQGLLDSAMRHNPDYLALQASIQVQRADLLAQKNALLPNVDLFVGAANRRFSEYSIDGVGNFDTNFSPNIRPDQRMPNPLPDYALKVQVGWELDLWGRLNNMRKAAAYRYMASEAGLRWQRASLAALVAESYYEVLALNEAARIVQENIITQQTAVELVKLQQAAGRTTALAVQQTEAQLFRTKALGQTVANDRIKAANKLQLLLGKYPAQLIDTAGLMQAMAPTVQRAGIPAQWLLQRPDVQQAAAELDAAGFDTRSAEAAFFPRLMLTPEFGLQGFNAERFFDPASFAWQIAGGLTAPVFQQRQLKAGLMQAQARQNQAFQHYRKVSLTAYNEVYEALLLADNLDKAFEEKEKEVNSLRQGVRTAAELFAAGYATYLEVLIAQNDMLVAEMELVKVQQQRFANALLLYKALGGTW